MEHFKVSSTFFFSFMERPVAQKQEKVIADHTRTVNRLAWHTDHAFTLLSGSQDGTMKLWVFKRFYPTKE